MKLSSLPAGVIFLLTAMLSEIVVAQNHIQCNYLSDINQDDDSYRDTPSRETWTSGLGWLPIGNQLNFFTAIFEGNGHTTSSLYVNKPSDYDGLLIADAGTILSGDVILSMTNESIP